MSVTVVLGVSAVNGWLLTFSVAASITLVAGTAIRRAARRNGYVLPADVDKPGRRGLRRRAGALIALGPLVGLLSAVSLPGSIDTLTVVIVLGALALAAVGVVTERWPDADRITLAASAVAALAAVIAGASFGPTGVGALDAIGAFALIVLVTQVCDGQGNVDGLVSGIGTVAALGLFAIAGFAHQNHLAAVFVGLVGTCVGFLAFNTQPASLFAGRGGRLAIGFVLATGALAVAPVAGSARELTTPIIILGMLLVDGAFVVLSRLRRRHPLVQRRPDHLVHRLVAIGWSRIEAVVAVVIAQSLLAGVALFTARAVLSVWAGAVGAAVVLAVLAAEAGRAELEREEPLGYSKRVVGVILVVVAALIAVTAPAAIAANDVTDLMEDGRAAASRGLSAARDGDTITALGAFHEAALTFERARDKLDSPLVSGALAVPGVASNVHAARALARIGADLANAGESLTAAVHPEELEVVDGRLPLAVVQRITPKLEQGSRALSRALTRLDDVRDDPYLASPVRDAVDKIHRQLVQADREARHAADAARMAPVIFGGPNPRRYLLVVQNNAESRATGGFIGSYGIITAEDGKLTVGRLQRTNTWNAATRALSQVTITAPRDYLRRYTQYRPGTTLQNVNLSPDFPSVAQALMSLAPQAGVGNVDGVLSVDPQGLAALLQLTGPVTVEGWPTPIDAGNVVNVTLRDAYAAFARTPERADFLGDVAQAAVDKATSGRLGKPAKIAQVLGKAAHEGHFIMSFADPAQQKLAEQLDVAGQMARVHSDAIAVTTSNAGGNKIDYYLKRSVDYRVTLTPNDDATEALASSQLSVQLDNTAPDSGLPEIVIGPFDARFRAGENRSFVSLYSPLEFRAASLNGHETAISPDIERGRHVYSLYTDIFAKTASTITADLSGRTKLHDGWYSLEIRHQPTLNTDQVHVSVDVPEGWRIDKAPGMKRVFSRRVSVNLAPEKTTTLRVHVVADPDTWNLWERLKAGG